MKVKTELEDDSDLYSFCGPNFHTCKCYFSRPYTMSRDYYPIWTYGEITKPEPKIYEQIKDEKETQEEDLPTITSAL